MFNPTGCEETMRMPTVAAIAAAMLPFTLGSGVSKAEYRERCVAEYVTQSGWSDPYKVDCTYMTGMELDRATSTYNYDSLSLYAVIFWGQHQASVIKLNTTNFCGYTAGSCATQTLILLPMEGIDQEGRPWKLCSANSFVC
jgi:hypothetical protein